MLECQCDSCCFQHAGASDSRYQTPHLCNLPEKPGKTVYELYFLLWAGLLLMLIAIILLRAPMPSKNA